MTLVTMLRLQTLAGALLALLLSALPASAQSGSTHIVSILGTDQQWRSYQAKAVPLLFNRARFGWRLHIGGPDRMVQLVEIMTTSQPMAYVVPSPNAEVNPEMTKVTVRLPLFVSNGYVQRAQGITHGDPPGTYTYAIFIDGELRGEFAFCAVEVPDQDAQIDPRTLNCPDKFDAAEAKASFLPLF